VILEIETWLKTTIPGIIVLGSLGSIVAILAVRTWTAVFPMPLKMHKKRRGKQAYILGHTAAVMGDDEPSNMAVSFMTFHLACLMIYLMFCLISVEVFLFSIIMVFPIFTSGGVISVIGVLLSIYFAYFEFEYIYRTYLYFWGASLHRAAERYGDRDDSSGKKDTGPRSPA